MIVLKTPAGIISELFAGIAAELFPGIATGNSPGMHHASRSLCEDFFDNSY